MNVMYTPLIYRFFVYTPPPTKRERKRERGEKERERERGEKEKKRHDKV